MVMKSFRARVSPALILAATCMSSLDTSSLLAQERVRIFDRPTCPRCTISVTPIIQLGEGAGPGTIDHMQSTGVRTSQGHYLVIGSYSTSIKVFGPDARFRRTIGRAGDGPGEYRGIAAIRLDAGDSLHVFDNMNRRHTVLAPGLTFVRSSVLPFAPGLAVAPDGQGQWVFNASLRTPAQIGLPLHLVGGDGRLLRSFGSESGAYRPDIPFLTSRAIAPAGTSRIWSAHRVQYVIDLIDVASGQIVKQLIREAHWFPSRLRPTVHNAVVGQPEPFVLSVAEDAGGLLWVFIGVADSQWRSTVRPPGPGAPHGEIVDEQAYWNTRIEVLDPTRGTLVAAREIPTYLRYMIASDIAGTVLLDDDDHPRLHFWRLGLSQPR